jgi:hypothetical protein
MTARSLGLALAFALASTVAATATSQVPITDLPEYAKAKATAQAVLDSTRALLSNELKATGAVGAIGSCSAVAMAVALEHEREGWRVRRVSLKLRNPADAPEPAERAILKAWERRHRRAPLAPETESVALVERAGRRTLRYMKPIVIGSEMCLACHAATKKISPEVRQALREWYPADKATGYKLGDLRGAISVSIPVEPAGSSP